jgi:hypothetical protein
MHLEAHLKVPICLFAGLLLVSAAQAGNIVQNPNFEDPTPAADVMPGWDAGPFFLDSNFPTDPGPHGGSRFAASICGTVQPESQCFLHPLSQLLPTTDGTYTLSFWFDLNSSEDDDQLGGTGLVVKWGDQTVLSMGTRGAPDPGYQFAMIPGLQGNAAQGVELQFIAFNTTDRSVGIDDVSAIETDPAPVPTVSNPEPAGWCLFGSGFLGLAAFVRRRRSAPTL